MRTEPDLQLTGTAHVDGEALACGSCGNDRALEIHKDGFREVWPAWISCLSCGAGESSPVVTNGLVDAALTARTGRVRPEDSDTFTAEWRGIVMTGEIFPDFVLGDAIAVVQALHDQVAKDTKAWTRSKKKEAKARAKAAARTATEATRKKAGGAANTAKAAALSTAWTLQTGGAGPTTVTKPKPQRCTVKGCRGGMVTLSSKLHSPTGKTREVKIPCAVCGRSKK
ncbi:hypothetical protein [Streptomyces nitrosporeus]|uniref:hypothetical protein n=1 Tax=Streptomyces nitrosporeus TaxID=28894 RepID=UPI00167E41FB|nr:hypothetical protein [Streptomyces nitrosporeus]GGZ19689.1 hypothetical protein GCM10010327_58540 [Streptomyces nitrosporeus]